MMTMIIYPGKKVPRFVLSHNSFRYFLVTMFVALVICLYIYSFNYEFRTLCICLIMHNFMDIMYCFFMYYILYGLFLLLWFVCLINFGLFCHYEQYYGDYFVLIFLSFYFSDIQKIITKKTFVNQNQNNRESRVTGIWTVLLTMIKGRITVENEKESAPQ